MASPSPEWASSFADEIKQRYNSDKRDTSFATSDDEEEEQVEQPKHSRSAVIAAAKKIQRLFRRFRDVQTFKFLCRALIAQELKGTESIIREVNPVEKPQIFDKTVEAKIRFRFGGSSFPPKIYFKVFTKSQAKYMSGRTMITAGSQASLDAENVMGRRRFLDLVIEDIVNSNVHCPTVQDYVGPQTFVKEQSHVDQLPVSYGGKNNGWRLLFDEGYSYNQNLAHFDMVSEVVPFPSLLDRVVAETDDMGISPMLRHANAIRAQYTAQQQRAALHGRGTSEAKKRSNMMRQAYMNSRGHDPAQSSQQLKGVLKKFEATTNPSEDHGEPPESPSAHVQMPSLSFDPMSDEDLDAEADDLIRWSNKLPAGAPDMETFAM